MSSGQRANYFLIQRTLGQQERRSTMESRHTFAFTMAEIECVLEAIQARISLVQTFPPSAWRYSRLSTLNNVLERLDQLLEQVEDEQAMQVGKD
jgi:uncharacterized membrane protein YccC